MRTGGQAGDICAGSAGTGEGRDWMCSGYEENWKQEMNRRRRMLVLEILRRSRSEGNALAQEKASAGCISTGRIPDEKSIRIKHC